MGEVADCMYDYRPEREEAEATTQCDGCGAAMYQGDKGLEIGIDIYCEECIDKMIIYLD